MNIGNPVRVVVDNKERTGTILSLKENTAIVGIGEPHYFNYQEKEVPINELKRYYPITAEAEENAKKILLTDGFEMTKDLLQAILPTEIAEIKDDAISGYYDAVSLETVVTDAPRIGGIQEVTAYSVTIWKSHPATRYEPEDVSDHPVGTYRSLSEAVQVFVETIFKLKCKDYMQSKAEEEFFYFTDSLDSFGQPYMNDELPLD